MLICWMVIYPVDSAICLFNNSGQINFHSAMLDSATGLLSTYPRDSDLTGEWDCPAFELLGAYRNNSFYNGHFTFHFTLSFVLISMQGKKREIVDK